jgi:phosphoribosylformylglycinamidine synthase II
MAVLTPDNLDPFMAVCRKWDVTATVIGTVTDTGRLRMRWYGRPIVDIPPRTAAHEGPVYDRPIERPADQDALNADGAPLARPRTVGELRDTLLELVGAPNLADKSWVTDQYDRYVLGNTVLAQPEDAGMIRIADDDLGPSSAGRVRGIALATDGNGRFARLDPYTGAQLALAEAYRNVASTGARPLAVTNCLNFGSPEDPAVMWQFSEAVRGLADGCQQLGVPVTGGNVSFYNQTGETAILPTPVIGVLGVIEDVSRRVRHAFRGEGAAIYLLGDTHDEFGGSEWAHTIHGHLGGRPPRVDLERERVLAGVLIDAGRDGLIDAAHDLADGGLAQALVECCMHGDVGARITLPAGIDPFVSLFAESAGRAIVTVQRPNEAAFEAMCAARGLPQTQIGLVDVLAIALQFKDLFDISVHELRETSAATLPALFG